MLLYNIFYSLVFYQSKKLACWNQWDPWKSHDSLTYCTSVFSSAFCEPRAHMYKIYEAGLSGKNLTGIMHLEANVCFSMLILVQNRF